MRSIALAVCAVALCVSYPAQATKYKCIFLQDGNAVGEPCVIDSNDTNNNTCQRIYNRTLAGKCFASQQNEQLNCLFFNQTTRTKNSTGNVAKAGPTSGPSVMAEEPGFVTGAGVWNAKSLTTGYKRNRTGPTLIATCGIQ